MLKPNFEEADGQGICFLKRCYKMHKRMRINFWLVSADKIKTFDSIRKQSSQTQTQLIICDR